jgi:hypothetical protein
MMTMMNREHRTYKLAKVLIVSGLLLILLAMIIPFSEHLDKVQENRLYLRFITVSGLMSSIGALIAFKKDFYLTNLLGALSLGIFSFLLTSTARFFIVFDTKLYYTIPVYVIVISLVVITISRLCFNKIYHYFKSSNL